jgi:fructose-1,6-bisphosphatase/inositol monophosphatase family enzyme
LKAVSTLYGVSAPEYDGGLRITPDELQATVADVHEAGRTLRESQAAVSWTLKPDGSFVTDLDRRIEDRLRMRLETRFPGWTFVGEEGAPAAGAPDQPRIILDPIDGTAAYARGLNFYAISLALLGADGPALAVLHLPGMGRWAVATFDDLGPHWYAVDGPTGRVEPGPAPTRRAVPVDGWGAYLYVGSDPHAQLDLSRWSGKVRALGATAAHLGLLLDDTIDPLAVVVTRYKVWDVAAGLALTDAAGFETRDLRASERRLTVADVARADVLPPLLVGRPEVVASLLPAIGLSPSRG